MAIGYLAVQCPMYGIGMKSKKKFQCPVIISWTLGRTKYWYYRDYPDKRMIVPGKSPYISWRYLPQCLLQTYRLLDRQDGGLFF